MINCSDEQEDQFYDTREDLSSVSDWGSDCSEDSSFGVLGRLGYEIWAKNLDGVQERRHKFLKWMGIDLDRDFNMREEMEDECYDKTELGIDRIAENGGAVLRNSGLEEDVSSSRSIMSSLSNEAPESSGNVALEENLFDGGRRFSTYERSLDGLFEPQKVRSNQSVSTENSKRNCVGSPSVQRVLQREVHDARYKVELKKKVKRGWLKKLGIGMCVVDANANAVSDPGDPESTLGMGMQRVRSHPCKKRTKELSSLYAGQEFQAHDGSILTMKFSLDGQYLASAGEDGIVRVWKVNEAERLDKFDTSNDPSCVYFTMDHLSRLELLDVEKEKHGNTKRMKRSSDSTCVVFPPTTFHILEKPLHEFRGHRGEVLDLSWSNKGFLLSSSVDNTVRLWQVGYDRCLRVFSHNNYVTCVDFNPLDDNYFISGSIDGKVRIWEVIRCKVVDYIDIREIVTAVSYHPDGQGGIVGSMTGNCRFYNILDNHLQLDAQICLQGKKKSPGKRITGFQFSPSDPSKVMVSSADSIIRIICGVDVICKFKGLRNAASQMSASFTSDGKHVISASEDSNVYVWNYSSQDKASPRTKKIWSCESFPSHNASIAVPWCGLKIVPDTIQSPTLISPRQGSRFDNASPDCFSLSRGFLLDSLSRGAATWPEEKLFNLSPKALSPTICKSEYRLLKNAYQSMSGSPHMWGLAIVTAGWDGRIRTYQNFGLPVRD
ncbi:hypothetical protein FEM48_Zijuj11G0007400 [Ziziphus jujuba var. spinosa]|uniref:WD repeat-containing protein 44 n=1 Tax=Ziziphus jujuba var. spinosa TaxID=714518 RepID=A0A978UFV6_ZIZJJ|nr:WD repeat-containing protein 44 [Ziziphus jujuba var. spinosa]KAH7513687.1 hypothetical protein FEM48_Zijuj11G0007400 [Ziziphus jujuba var. spinosa]